MSRLPPRSPMSVSIARFADRRVVLVVALLLAWAGMAAHDAYELPELLPASPQFTLPTAVYLALGAAWIVHPNRLTWALLLVWTVLNLAVGGVLTVLPLPILPFVPEQTMGHYLAHVIYTATQVPLLLVLLGRPVGPRYIDGDRSRRQ